MAEEHERGSAALKADTESSLAMAKAEHAAAVVSHEQTIASLSAEHSSVLTATKHEASLHWTKAKAAADASVRQAESAAAVRIRAPAGTPVTQQQDTSTTSCIHDSMPASDAAPRRPQAAEARGFATVPDCRVTKGRWQLQDGGGAQFSGVLPDGLCPSTATVCLGLGHICCAVRCCCLLPSMCAALCLLSLLPVCPMSPVVPPQLPYQYFSARPPPMYAPRCSPLQRQSTVLRALAPLLIRCIPDSLRESMPLV